MADLSNELRRPTAYPFPVDDVEVVETHISWVFLAGPFAYKVKKPVDLGFVDYSTPDRRRAYCEAEVRLNGRLAPDVYIGVAPVTRWGDSFQMEGAGEIVDYAVKMHRLPAERMLHRLLADGKVTVLDVQRLARQMAAFHASAASGPGIDEFGGRRVIEQNWHENFEQVRPFEGRWLTHAQFAEIYGFVTGELARLAPVFERRVAGGRIRDCHGDLRAESVWMDEAGGFQVFDCIEFNDRFRFGDVASEVAFLATDLDWRGRPDLAWSWVDAYVEASGDTGLREVLPFYKCYRAFVRGKVEALEQHGVASIAERSHHGRAAREHFDLAELYTLRFAPTLFVVCGPVASGKTTLARGLASILGLRTISSDRVRKQLAGMDPLQHARAGPDQGIYSPELTRRTYDELLRRAGEELDAGGSPVLDATFSQPGERERALRMAGAHRADAVILELEAADSLIYQRLAARAEGEPTESDAGREVFEHVRTRFESADGIPARNLLRVDGSGSVQTMVLTAIASIRHRLTANHPLTRTA